MLCALRRSRRRWTAAWRVGYIQFFRITPEMVLIFWGYFCLPLLLGLADLGLLDREPRTLGLVAAAYLAEIFRAGIEAVPRGRGRRRGRSGCTPIPLWRRVVLPQALRLMIPPFVNYFTELVKNTTLLSAIGVGELSLQAYLLGGQTFRYVEFLTVIAFGYFLVIFPATVLARRLERGAAGCLRPQQTEKRHASSEASSTGGARRRRPALVARRGPGAGAAPRDLIKEIQGAARSRSAWPRARPGSRRTPRPASTRASTSTWPSAWPGSWAWSSRSCRRPGRR